MKIFIPAGSFYPAQIGGPDNIMYWHAKALTRRGHQFWIATTDDGIGPEVPKDRWLDTDFGRAIYVKTAVHYAPFKLLFASLGPLWRADIVHLSNIFYPASWLLAPLALLLGKKVVWTVHGELDPDGLVYSTGRKKWVLKLVNRLAPRCLFHSTCDAETQYVKNTFGASTGVIQVPYFMELTPKLARTPENYWLYVGRIHPKKAVEQLIKALPLVRVKKSLKIIGDYANDYGKQLMELVQQMGLGNQVEFLGHKQGTEKYQLMANAYCMIMPSHTENFGIVVTEALTQGTPVIASLGTPWQILSDRKAGQWVSNEVPQLAAALNEMANLDAETYNQYRANALKLVDEYDIQKNSQKWESIYEQVLQAKKPVTLP